MGSFRARERENFESPEWEQRLIQMIAQLKQLPWMCLVEPSKGRRREVNKDFERFELGPKEEEEKRIRTLSALSLVQRKRRNGR